MELQNDKTNYSNLLNKVEMNMEEKKEEMNQEEIKKPNNKDLTDDKAKKKQLVIISVGAVLGLAIIIGIIKALTGPKKVPKEELKLAKDYLKAKPNKYYA